MSRLKAVFRFITDFHFILMMIPCFHSSSYHKVSLRDSWHRPAVDLPPTEAQDFHPGSDKEPHQTLRPRAHHNLRLTSRGRLFGVRSIRRDWGGQIQEIRWVKWFAQVWPPSQPLSIYFYYFHLLFLNEKIPSIESGSHSVAETTDFFDTASKIAWTSEGWKNVCDMY